MTTTTKVNRFECESIFDAELNEPASANRSPTDDEAQEQTRTGGMPLQSAQALFPSCLCSAIVPIVDLLDDSSLTADGPAVCDLANQVIGQLRRRAERADSRSRLPLGGALVPRRGHGPVPAPRTREADAGEAGRDVCHPETAPALRAPPAPADRLHAAQLPDWLHHVLRADPGRGQPEPRCQRALAPSPRN